MRVAAIVHTKGENPRLIVTTDGVEALQHHYGPGEEMIILDADHILTHCVPDLAKIKKLIAEKVVA